MHLWSLFVFITFFVNPPNGSDEDVPSELITDSPFIVVIVASSTHNWLGQSEEVEQHWSGLKIFDICVVFGCYGQSFTFRRGETGQ